MDASVPIPLINEPVPVSLQQETSIATIHSPSKISALRKYSKSDSTKRSIAVQWKKFTLWSEDKNVVSFPTSLHLAAPLKLTCCKEDF